MPKFGLQCQYEFHFYRLDNASLDQIINDFYDKYRNNPNTLTCYTHLQCNRDPLPACLDWSKICDGKIDCLDGGSDEKYCWELKYNEYRCQNGKCIPQS